MLIPWLSSGLTWRDFVCDHGTKSSILDWGHYELSHHVEAEENEKIVAFFWQINKKKVKIILEVQFLACTSVLASMPTTKKIINLAQKIKSQCQTIDGFF